MQEALLHYIWEFQYFDHADLKTSAGEQITIFHPGFRNTHAGPDFSNARIKIGEIEWIGNVEIHIYSSGWRAHKHHIDGAYENVVLHVVWAEDEKVTRMDGTVVPTLQLQNRVDEGLMLKYNTIVLNPQPIPCGSTIPQVRQITRYSMLDKALSERLQKKSNEVSKILDETHNDWEETCYRILLSNFGFKVNAQPMMELAKALPYKIVMKHVDKITQVEALLFGQAGMLDDTHKDSYFVLLKREYSLLSHKFDLEHNKLNKAIWKFLRLRPANFPTVRIAQVAALLHTHQNIFSKLLSATGLAELQRVFSVDVSEYWKHHYLFDKYMQEGVSSLGKSSIENVIVNTVVVLLVAYGKLKDDQSIVDRAVEILQSIKPEENIILKKWSALGVRAANAFDSQALIELHNSYCMKKRCLDCTIGSSLIRPTA
jgi:hypothetical protein